MCQVLAYVQGRFSEQEWHQLKIYWIRAETAPKTNQEIDICGDKC